MSPTPDFLFIDTILLAYRLGRVSYEEQQAALLAAARAATDAMSFLTALENLGVGRRTQLFHFVGELLSAPNYYRAQYPTMLGLRHEGEPAPTFLNNPQVTTLVEPILTKKQQRTFFDAYWWFAHNHEATTHDIRNGQRMGLFADEPKDNAATLPRFEEYLQRLMNHKNMKIRQRYEGFPIDIVMAILNRAFL